MLIARPIGSKKQGLGSFYAKQNEHIASLLKSIDNHALENTETESDNALKVKIAIYASFAANCCLAVLQLYAAASSLSLSFFASASRDIYLSPYCSTILPRQRLSILYSIRSQT